MKFTITADEVAEFAKLAPPETISLKSISFMDGDQVELNATFDIPPDNTLKTKIFSKVNKLTGTKTIRTQITAPSPDAIEITIKRAGLKWLGPMNLFIPVLLKNIVMPLVLKFTEIEDKIPEWLELKGESILRLNLSNALQKKGLSVEVKTINLQNNTCDLELTLSNNKTEQQKDNL